jgi:acyl-CoA thioesterase-1
MRKIKTTAFVVLTFAILFTGCDNSPDSTNHQPIVCFGDSLTEGFGASKPGSVDKTKSYPAFLRKKVSRPVVNSGISGDTAAGGLARVERDVLAKDPGIVIILLGANDFFRLRPANETQADLQAIIDKLASENRKIYLASFIGDEDWEAAIFGAIPGLSSTVIAALLPDYKKMFAELKSENKDIGYIPDIWTGVWGIHMSDPIHPNSKGYEIIANTIFNAIKPALAN